MAGCRSRRLSLLLAVLGLLACSFGPATPAGAAASVQREELVIGTSVQGRPITAVHRWRAADVRAKPLLVIGTVHGDEGAGRRVVRRLSQTRLPRGVDLWLVRDANPDGTAADRRTNAHGVDLNRNFPRRWLQAGAGTSTWSGPSAASEPETRALRALVRTVRPHTTVVLHQPLFGVDSYRAKSMTLVRDLSRGTGLPVRYFDCSGGCHGTFTDWHNDRTPGRAVTVEFGHRASAGRVDRVAAAVTECRRDLTGQWAAGSRRSSQPGSHQLCRPSSAIAAGSSTARTIVASMSTAVASPIPSCLNSSSDSVAKMLNTPIITAAALVTTPAEAVTPRATAARVGSPSACASRTRLTTKTW